MSHRREHPDDELVQLEPRERGLHVRWRRHDSGDHYGGDAFDDDAREVLLQEGVDPDEFFPSAPHPF
ncbi:MAG TPA: hypothetical protein VNR37_04880 [Microbacteriaceae bacterium]|nr:hypothetical protein [Microbacteriaceae bacterium]